VRKTQDLDRKNMVRVSITEKGRQAYDKSNQEKVHLQDNIFVI